MFAVGSREWITASWVWVFVSSFCFEIMNDEIMGLELYNSSLNLGRTVNTTTQYSLAVITLLISLDQTVIVADALRYRLG